MAEATLSILQIQSLQNCLPCLSMDHHWHGNFEHKKKIQYNQIVNSGSLENVLQSKLTVTHYQNISHRERCSRALTYFRTVRNHCKRVLGNTKYIHAKAAQTKFERKRLEYRDFQKIFNQLLRRGESSVPNIINNSCHIILIR